MGKSWKSRAHTKTGYPYNPIRASHLQVLRPKIRQEDEENLFLGIYAEGHPVFSKAEFKAAGPELKHLQFLRSYCQYYVAKVGSVYTSGRAFLPPLCLAGLSSVESRVTSLSAPLLSGLQTGGERVLWTLDTKVDAVVRTAHSALHPVSESRLERAIIPGEAPEAQQAYLQKLEGTVQFLRDNGLMGTARLALGSLLERLDAAQVTPAAGEELPMIVWGKFAALPPVNRLLEKAQPSVEYTQRKYADAHDAIVSSAIYNRGVETAAEMLQRLTETSVFKVAAERLYPAVSGIADPALERIVSSAYTRAVIEHLKPVHREEEKSYAPLISCTPC